MAKITLSSPVALLFMMVLLLPRVNSQESVSFTFKEFTQSSKIFLQGDATYSSDMALQLTKVDSRGNPQGGSVGRALYSDPIRLHDKSDRRVALISTTFTFLISSPSSNPADGLTFFIAPADTAIPPDSGGAFLGLMSNDGSVLKNSSNEFIGFKESSDSFVAVEFDTFPNNGIDPEYRHVGINVNKIRSEKVTQWEWQNGERVNATIEYDHNAKRLRAFACKPNGILVGVTLSPVDLTTVLPEWVRVGFSASTGKYSQVNKVMTWSYSSVLGKKSYVVDQTRIASIV